MQWEGYVSGFHERPTIARIGKAYVCLTKMFPKFEEFRLNDAIVKNDVANENATANNDATAAESDIILLRKKWTLYRKFSPHGINNEKLTQYLAHGLK